MENRYSSIAFSANYLKNVDILRRTRGGNYKPYEVSLAKIDVKNKFDIMSLKRLSQKRGEFSYAESVYQNMKYARDTLGQVSPQCDVFVLTKQKKDFDRLSSSKILGFMEYQKKARKVYRVNYLESDLENIYLFETEGFQKIKEKWLAYSKGVGKEIVIRLPNEEIKGEFIGLTDEGAVQIKTKDLNCRFITAGDVFFIDERKIND
jgi:hypothetical protein